MLMQKDKTKYDQIIKNIDKLTFDSLPDMILQESIVENALCKRSGI